jgi:alkaline phosphatase
MLLKVKKFLVFFLLALLMVGAAFNPVYAENGEAPKNIILMIGDGMGASQVTLTRLSKGELAMDSFAVGGTMTTYPLPSSGTITDSAAAGTALATSFKTDNGIISQSPEGKNYYTVLEKAQDDGKSTGLVTTTRITHATPAVFASHILDRDAETEIADQFVEADVDVLLGGGLRHFIPQSQSGSKRKDDRDLTKEFQSKGYIYVNNTTDLLVNKEAPKLLGLFTKSHMSYELDRNATQEPSLAEMTEVAIDILSKNSEGFFLMVEGGRIDHASHANDAATTVADTKAFDDAVVVALNFAKVQGETLVIVTADHKTGGLAIGRGNEQWCKPEVLNGVKASAEERLAPLLKQDTSKEAIRQVFEKYTGITDLSDEEIAGIQAGLVAGEGYAITDPIVEVVNSRAHVGWTTHEHDGTAVPIFAYGPEAELFGGFIDNTDVGKAIHELLGERVSAVSVK